MSTGSTRSRLVRSPLSSVVAALSLCLVVLAAAGCGSAGPEREVAVGDIQAAFDGREDAPEREALIGQQITVSAEVADVLAPRVILLSGDRYGVAGVLVIAPDGAEVSEGEVVQVVGRVEQFEPYDEEYGVDFQAGTIREYEGEPVIVASSVDRAGNG